MCVLARMQVVDGSLSVVKAAEAYGSQARRGCGVGRGSREQAISESHIISPFTLLHVSQNGETARTLMITDCGEVQPEEK